MTAKRLATYLLITWISISSVIACGYFPYGEDIRFSIVEPEVFGLEDFRHFFYTTEYYDYMDEDWEYSNNRRIDGGKMQNLLLWKERCNNIPSIADIEEAIYTMGISAFTTSKLNSFINYLNKTNDKPAIEYLRFAKESSPYNNYTNDPWEYRDKTKARSQQLKLIQQGIDKLENCKDNDLQKRYAFLIIRLSFYAQEYNKINEIFEKYLSDSKTKDIIYYWSLHFKTIIQENGPERNYNAAQVFMNAPDKRKAINPYYNRDISVKQALKYAKSSNEKAAIWLIEAAHNPAHAFKSIQKVYDHAPKSEAFIFLLIREINKLEDWILTPNYTNYSPSVELGDYENWYHAASIKKRMKSDRKYAGRFQDFLRKINASESYDPFAIELAKNYLSLIQKDFIKASVGFEKLKHASVSQKKRHLAEKLFILSKTAEQDSPKATILPDYKDLILKEIKEKNNDYIFALVKELEFQGSYSEAVKMMIAMINEWDWDEWRYTKVRMWKASTIVDEYYQGYYDDYFFYLNNEYSVEQVKKIIADLETHKGVTEFDKYLKRKINTELPRLYDLLGTQYIRLDKLELALEAFKHVDDTLWTSEHQAFSTYLDANPFHANLYSEHQKTSGDTITFTKLEITQKLIEYLKMAEDPNNPDRDYYYYLVANCYFNMTHNGNSWMMRRYFWSRSCPESLLPDNDEFYNADLAKKFYMLAKKHAVDKSFEALCLRMAGRCDLYKIRRETPWKEMNKLLVEKDYVIYYKNPYYDELADKYPEDLDELISFCESFEKYYGRRVSQLAD